MPVGFLASVDFGADPALSFGRPARAARSRFMEFLACVLPGASYGLRITNLRWDGVGYVCDVEVGEAGDEASARQRFAVFMQTERPGGVFGIYLHSLRSAPAAEEMERGLSPAWPQHREFAERVVLVSLEDLARCAARSFSPPWSQSLGRPATAAGEVLEEWKSYGDVLDAYVAPGTAGALFAGVRYGVRPDQYLGIACNPDDLADLLAQYRPGPAG